MGDRNAPDREKVIKGIEHHMKGECGGCPYCKGWHACEAGSERGLFTNALALLKAQEPRVMKLEELEGLGDDGVVYLECRYIVDGMSEVKPAIFQPNNSSPEKDGYYCVVSSWGKSGFYHKDSYTEEWRCWTSRPTDEQREKVKWDA